jgi:apolipoprotein N-acyltransferase
VLFAALPVLLWLLDGSRSARTAFGIGWYAGAGYFAASLFWIVEPFLVDAPRHGWMSPFALLGMAGGLALFWAVPFALAGRAWPHAGVRILLLASFWTLSDYARSAVLTGFPWGLTAYAWVETPVIQAVALVGPHGLGFLTLLAALLVGLASRRALGLAVMLVAAGWGYGAWQLSRPLAERDPPLVVRIVQPNAEQQAKWVPEKQMEFYRRLLAETSAPGDPSPDVTIWPETAVPFVLGWSDDNLSEVAAAAGPQALTILGIRRIETVADREAWFNSLVVLGPDGFPRAVYDKHHLVPFGEYVPLSGLVARLGMPALTTLTAQGFRPGPGPRLISVPGLPPFLPLICYEAIFPQGMRAPEGRPDWLVQVTNDAWFGEMSGPWQHLAQARVRAIEQGLPLARSANTGISAMIDPLGRITDSLGLGMAGHFDATLPAARSSTLYSSTGDLPVFAALILICGLTVLKLWNGVFRKTRR